MTATDLAVVVVNYNTRDLLRSCLETVRAEGAEGITEVVVVDNASSDGSPGMIAAEFPEVRLLANRHNPGYGAGANQGVAACRAPYVLVLNSDTLLGEGSVSTLADWLDRHPRAAIAGPRLLNPDGTLQSSCFPELTPFNVLALNTGLNRLARLLPRFRPTWRGTPSKTGHWVKGAALAIRREAFAAVGGFDESYFMYAEEVDLCLRLNAAGWEVHYTPSATVVHVEGASTGQNRHAMAARLFASLEQLYRRHDPERLPRLRRVLKVVLLERIVRDRWKMWRYPERRARLEGDLALWRRMMGPHPPAPSPSPPEPPLPGEGETCLRRLDWHLLLPGGFEHLILLGGTQEVAKRLVNAGVARRVSESPGEPADAVAVLRGAGVSPNEAARCLAPGGWLYWESDERRSLRSPFAVPGRAVDRLRACGLSVAGVWAVWPGFERHEAYVPVEDMGWFARAGYPGRTFKERMTGAALCWTRNGALITRFFAIVARAGAVADTDGPVLLTHGAERVVLLRDDVRKIPRLPAFNAKTVREQEVLSQVRGLLDLETARALPKPLGTVRYGDRIASVESLAPGRPLVLSCMDWGVPLRRKIRDLQLAVDWLTRFHLQTLIGREPWDGRETVESFAAFRDRFGVSPKEKALFDFALGLSRELAGVPLPIVWRHRDFTPWNLLVDRGHLTVLDWEGAQPGPALCDLLHFVSHWHELAPEGATEAGRQVIRYCERLGIEPRFIPLLRVYTRVEIALRSQVRTRDADYVTALAEELRRAA
jgi:hypothetical protein